MRNPAPPQAHARGEARHAAPHVGLRALAFLLAMIWGSAGAWGGAADLPGEAAGWQQVSYRAATVLVPDPELVSWAREVAVRADRAVRIAAAFWDVPPPAVHVVIDDRDERFNAWVDPLSGPVIHLRTRGPVPGEVGLSAPDPLLLLLVHEAIHAVHFGARPGTLPVRTGIVGGDLPWPPPSWLLEGAAVWAESRLLPGGGGRLDDAEVTSLLRLLAHEGPWPSLADASLITHGDWPAGEVRYLLGGAFVGRLVDRYGLPVLRSALRRFETQAPWLGFAHAWRMETGEPLEEEWQALRQQLRREAGARAAPDLPGLVPGRAPARSPDGRQLAWLEGDRLRVARWPEVLGYVGGSEPRVHSLDGSPDRLAWWGRDRLVYVRIHATPGGRLRELVALDLTSGREEVLTEGARAFHASPLAGGCILFVRDSAPEGSSLRRWCRGGSPSGAVVWTPPPGQRIVGLAASAGGRVAAVLWEAGATRLVELVGPGGPGAASWPAAANALPAPPGNLRDPVWEGEDAILVRSDAEGETFESWRVDLREERPVRLTATLGGVVGHAPGVVAVRRIGGPELLPSPGPVAPTGAPRGEAAVAGPPAESLPPAEARPPAIPAPAASDTQASPYRPWDHLRILGWQPLAAAPGEVGVAVLAADPSGTAGVRAVAGVSSVATGPAGPVFAGATLLLGEARLVPTPQRPAPVRSRIRAGVLPYRPHRSDHRALVPRIDLTTEPLLALHPTVRGRLSLSALLLEGDVRLGGSVRLSAAEGRTDAWGVPRHGWTAALTAVADPLPGGAVSWGGWADSAVWKPAAWPGEVRTSTRFRAGWRAPRVVPAGPWGERSATLAGGVEWTLPLHLRVGDGRWAWERVRVEPALRLQGAAEGAQLAFGAGGEVTVAADLVLGYGAPVSVAVTAGAMSGEDGGAWLRLALPGLP